MPAPKGNEFWKLRSKHGRDKLFKTPELLWEAACEYFEWCDANPLTSQEWVGKDGDEVERRHPRPFTLQGLCVYLNCNTSFWRNSRSNYPQDNQEFAAVFTRIEDIIYNQKFTGAAVGHYSATLIARDLGLIDKKELDVPNGINIKIVRA